MTQDVELVEDDLRLRGMSGLERRVASRRAGIGAEPGIEGIHAGFGAVGAAEPDGPAAESRRAGTHDNSIGMPRPDREFVAADDLGAGMACPVELLLHVRLVEIFDGVPVEMKVLGSVLDGGDTTVASRFHRDREALGVTRVVGKPVELFAFHGLAVATADAPNVDLQVDAPAAAIEVAYPASRLIVEGAMTGAAQAAACFFRRRFRAMTTA